MQLKWKMGEKYFIPNYTKIYRMRSSIYIPIILFILSFKIQLMGF